MSVTDGRLLRQVMVLDQALHSVIETLTERAACGHPEAVIVKTLGGTETVCPRCGEVDGAA